MCYLFFTLISFILFELLKFLLIFFPPIKISRRTRVWRLDFEFLDMFFETAITLSIFKLHTYTVHPESIHSPFTFSTFCYVTALIQNWIKLFFFLKILHTIPHNDIKWKTVLFPLIIHANVLKNNKLESTCGKFSWLDMILKGTDPFYIRSHSWQCMSEHKPSMKSKELSVDLWDRIDLRNKILGRLQKKFCCFEGPKWAQWPPSSVNGRSSEPPGLFLELAGHLN